MKIQASFAYKIKKMPKEKIWPRIGGDSVAPDLKLSDAFDQFSKTSAFLSSKWIRYEVLPLQKMGFFKMKIGEISYGDFGKDSSGLPNNSQRSRFTAVSRLMRFALDGATQSYSKSGRSTTSSPDTVSISQHDYLSEEQALELIASSSGKHAEFREMIIKKIKEMPDKSAYAFVPNNMPSEEVERKKVLIELRKIVKQAIDRSGENLDATYVNSKNIFVLIRKKPQTKGAK